MAGVPGARLKNVAAAQARKTAAPDLTGESWASNRFGALAVGLAMVLALATFTVFSGFTPIVPTNTIVTFILIGDALIVVVLVTIIGLALWRLRRARKTSRAGARLHARVIALFSLVAAIPAIVTATVATVAVEWTVKPGYLANFQAFINDSGQLSEFYRGFQCSTLLQNTARASDEIAQIAKMSLGDPARLQTGLNAVAGEFHFLNLAIISPDGKIVAMAADADRASLPLLQAQDFIDARSGAAGCPFVAGGQDFATLQPMTDGTDQFLYAVRAIDPAALKLASQAETFRSFFQAFESSRQRVELGYGVSFSCCWR